MGKQGKQSSQIRQTSPRPAGYVASLDLNSLTNRDELFVPLCTIVNISLKDPGTLDKMPAWALKVFNKEISPTIPVNNPDYSRIMPLQAQFATIQEAAQKVGCKKLVIVDSLGLQLINLDGLINFIHALDGSFTPVQLSRSDMLTHLEPTYRNNTIAKALESSQLCCPNVKIPSDVLGVKLAVPAEDGLQVSFFNWEALIRNKSLSLGGGSSLRACIDLFVGNITELLRSDPPRVPEALYKAILFNVKGLFKNYQKILLENKTKIDTKYLRGLPASYLKEEDEQAYITATLNYWQAQLPQTMNGWVSESEPALKACLETVTRYLVEEMIVIGLCMGPAIHPWAHGESFEMQGQSRGALFQEALAPTLRMFLESYGEELLGIKPDKEVIDGFVFPWLPSSVSNYFINIDVKKIEEAKESNSDSISLTVSGSQAGAAFPLEHKRKHSDSKSTSGSRSVSPLSDEEFRQKEKETLHRQLEAAARRAEAEAKRMEAEARVAEVRARREETEYYFLVMERLQALKANRIFPGDVSSSFVASIFSFFGTQRGLAVKHQQGMSEESVLPTEAERMGLAAETAAGAKDMEAHCHAMLGSFFATSRPLAEDGSFKEQQLPSITVPDDRSSPRHQ
ncbi:MAG: hypothetical protein K0S08_1117 [Gammaproteobacteria bacterium]|jgi:hypothetical protein|nr:hypothetical protein [Gammaproteobacteria bacterium]